MTDTVIIARYLIKERNDPFNNSNQQYYVCGHMAEQLINEMAVEELPEFLVSNDSLVRDCARSRLSDLMGW